MSSDISNSADIIDVRDIIARVEELEDERDGLDEGEQLDEDDSAELDALTELLNDLAGYGGDEQWRGAWYPVTLIRDDYFEDYARELANDIGAIDRNATWPANCIDWEQAASELQVDYSTVEYGEVTYWYR